MNPRFVPFAAAALSCALALGLGLPVCAHAVPAAPEAAPAPAATPAKPRPKVGLVLSGSDLELMLHELTRNVDNVENFDKLPIPYRAVATNMVTGKEVVLDLTEQNVRAQLALLKPGDILISPDLGNLSFIDFAAAPKFVELGIQAAAEMRPQTDRNDISASALYAAGSVFLAADTWIGPFYLAWGHASGGQSSFYIFLGRL